MSKKDAKPANTIGYANPPRDTRFKSGESGNYAGRPKKKHKPEPPIFNPARFPTRSLLRHEAARELKIRDIDGVSCISVTQAVLRSLEREALKGGPMAMRTYLQFVIQEDAAYHADKQKVFDVWSEIKAEQAAILERAKKEGREELDIVPHPDDIRLNWHELKVELLGPVDVEEKEAQDKRIEARDLMFELSIFYNEKSRLPDENGQNASVGLFFLTFVRIEAVLPRRLRCDHQKLHGDIMTRAVSGRGEWSSYLAKKCEEYGLPFFYIGRNDASPFSFPLDKLGFEFANGELRPSTPKLKRELKRMMGG
ncbi:DUF5681 domain-containing protein [Sphingorhabdus arenilitoris]|uniref:DUF5681 domain-containing protein n=1 Tax=Sphingorhabdus arenilitoris TaxID=1490041 RepID=A0ABV8RDJ9_9SPHN